MKRRVLLVLAAIALGGGLLSAQGLDFSFNGIRYNTAFPGILKSLPVPTGADVEFRLPVAEFASGPLAVDFRVAGGYEDWRILRDSATGDPISEKAYITDGTFGEYHYFAPNVQWDLGLVQGILPKDKGNLLEAFLLYRGRLDDYETSLSNTAFSDMRGIFGTSAIIGLGYDAVTKDSRRVKDGISSEVSAEWGPGGLNANSIASTDFYRFDFKLWGFKPLISYGQASDEGLNLLSVYLAGYASCDYAGGSDGGDNIPIYVLQSFGGRELRGSLGSCVRGYPSASYDSALKTVANGEIRVLGPALFKQAWFIPMVYAFCDAGYYSGLPGSVSKSDKSGVIMSSGGGFALDIIDFAYLGFSAGYLFPGQDQLFSTYVPDGTKTFFSVEFLLHF
jgi:hypothetical protein